MSEEPCLYDSILIFQRLYLHGLKILPGAPRARHSDVWVDLRALRMLISFSPPVCQGAHFAHFRGPIT